MATETTTDEVVPVVFRWWPGKFPEVLALFPTLTESNGHVVCYAHIGQHGAGDYRHCIRMSRPATPEEYAPLKRELEGAPYGYRLRVVQRRPKRPWPAEPPCTCRAEAGAEHDPDCLVHQVGEK